MSNFSLSSCLTSELEQSKCKRWTRNHLCQFLESILCRWSILSLSSIEALPKWEGSYYSTFFTAFGSVKLLNFCQAGVCEMIFYCDFNFNFLHCWIHLFILNFISKRLSILLCLLVICISFSVIFAYVICTFILVFFLCILYFVFCFFPMCSVFWKLTFVQVADIFSQVMAYLFTLYSVFWWTRIFDFKIMKFTNLFPLRFVLLYL